MKPSQLCLVASVIEEISLKALLPPTLPDATEISVSATPGFARADDNKSNWRVTLQVSFSGGGGKSAPYAGSINVAGFFTVTEDDEAKILKLVAVNAPTMLYSMAREVIAGLTGRGPGGVFLIPSISFADHAIVSAKAEEMLPAFPEAVS